MDWYQVGNFSIFETDKNKTLVLVLPDIQESPKDPYIVYDGKQHALFFFNNKKGLVLDYIHPNISKTLFNSASVLVCECMDKKELVKKRIYPVPVKKAKKLQVVFEKKKGKDHE